MSARIPDIRLVRQLIPSLSSEFHKGQAGRLGVVGGSEDYTGAPYFSGIAAMKLGVDLCHIFCEPDAATVIKSYSPDLIVHPYMRTTEKGNVNGSSKEDIVSRISTVFKRLHVLVVGPGLSRDTLMQETARELILKARQDNMPIVIDADGLYLVQKHPDTVQDYKKAVLTPNIVEFNRLCESKKIDVSKFKKEDIVQHLSKAFGGVTIVQKGSVDYISNGDKVLRCDTEGGLKRMGGQGDILSGLIGTFLAWGKGYEDGVWKHENDVKSDDIAMYAAWAACDITRRSAHIAYSKHGRAVLTSNILDYIGDSYDQFTRQDDSS
ncbi:Ribokinase-like protein [Pilobolus umbonatus]|nr:Ribokinase-like protein [Pilobolus umbonatus]